MKFPVFATYIHDLDPVIINLFGKFPLRWYGMAYLLGFIGAFVLLRWLGSRDQWELKKEQTSDFVTYGAFFGVFLGGRVGYVLFYHTRSYGWSWLTEDPLLLFRVWEGGMASHGGILGLVIFCYFYARKHKVSWLGLGDGLVTVAPLGVFAGRMANFINGEIYGKVAHGVSWAIKFPNALVEEKPESERFGSAMRAAAEADPSLEPVVSQWMAESQTYQLTEANLGALQSAKDQAFQAVVEKSRDSESVRQAVGEFLEPRHPVQLYEGLLEGLFLLLTLLAVRVFLPRLPKGFVTGLFFLLYGAVRIFAETYRIPSTQNVGEWKMGAYLSLFMLLAGAAFIACSLIRDRKSSTAS